MTYFVFFVSNYSCIDILLSTLLLSLFSFITHFLLPIFFNPDTFSILFKSLHCVLFIHLFKSTVKCNQIMFFALFVFVSNIIIIYIKSRCNFCDLRMFQRMKQNFSSRSFEHGTINW